jgi:hypothetical protein
MAEVRLQFSSDDREVLAALAKMEGQFNRVKDSAKRMGQESKQSSQEATTMFAVGSQQIAGYLTGLVSINTAISTLQAAYQGWQDRMRKAADEHRTFSQSVIADLTKTGDVFSADKIAQQLQNIQGVTREQSLAAFRGVSAGGPTASIDQRLALTREVARLAPTGGDLARIGETAAELSDMLPGRSAGDVVDITALMMSRAGADSDKLASAGFLRAIASLQQTGAATPAESLGLGLATLDANLKPDTIAKLAEAVNKSVQAPTDLRSRMSAEGQAMSGFAMADPRERLRLLLEDQATADAILGAGALKTGLINRDAIRARAVEISQAEQSDYAQRQVEMIRQSRVGTAVVQEQNIKLVEDTTQRVLGPEQAALEQARRRIQAEADRVGGFTSFAAGIGLAVEPVERTFQQTLGFERVRGAMRGVAGMTPFQAPMPSSTMDAIATLVGVSEETRDLMRKQIEEASRQTEELRKANQRPAGVPERAE